MGAMTLVFGGKPREDVKKDKPEHGESDKGPGEDLGSEVALSAAEMLSAALDRKDWKGVVKAFRSLSESCGEPSEEKEEKLEGSDGEE